MSDTRETGFLEEAPGVRSSARLLAVLFASPLILLALAAGGVALHGGEHAAGIVGALCGPMTPLAAGAWAALRERGSGSA